MCRRFESCRGHLPCWTRHTSPTPPHLADLLTAVAPALRALLTADELEGVCVVRGQNSVVLAVTARDEAFLHHLWLPGRVGESGEEPRDRGDSELQDAVAESRSAWGELRPWPPAPG